MNNQTLLALSGVGMTLAMFRPCAADFQNLQIAEHAQVMTAAGERKVYRIYAVFGNGADRLLSWGAAQFSTVQIYAGPCTGSAFFQAPQGGNTAPLQGTIEKAPDAQWDTFATIGVSVADQGVPFDLTTLSPGFPTFISGNQVTLNNVAVSVPVNAPQGRADFAGDGDPALRVLMMQLTMDPNEFPYGSVALTWRSAAGQTFQQSQAMWQALEAHGRCCLPTGSCILTYWSYCEQFNNGLFLNCDACDACENTCLPDIAPHPGNGEVNVDDLLAVILAWGPRTPWSTCPADVAPTFGNDVVNVDDLLVVISGWGNCP